MYIKKVEIRNVRSISEMVMDFPEPAGWHVLIGDNGAGKSSIIRSIALGLVGVQDALALRDNWENWLSKKSDRGSIDLTIQREAHYDFNEDLKDTEPIIPSNILFLKREERVVLGLKGGRNFFDRNENDQIYGTDPLKGYFSVAFGPYRRFAGGNPEWSKVFAGQPRLAAHLSAFGEDVALVEATDWLVKWYFQSLERHIVDQSQEAAELIEDFKTLINSPNFLPHQAKLEEISSEGVKFRDGNGNLIKIDQMSDGYRSILSLTFELIRQMISTYGAQEVFKDIRQGNIKIELPGVVLVDEIDAHLHPTWQTRIGEWFTTYFPKIQFIVTTHSPLVCRAAKDGTIWRLASPGSDRQSGQVQGIEKDRLVLGNVLDAYGTEIFGVGISISKDADDKLNRLAELNLKSITGNLNDQEFNELQKLKAIFPTEKPNTK